MVSGLTSYQGDTLMARCPTCFSSPQFPRIVAIRFPAGHQHAGLVSHHAEQCVDPCHDEHVLGRPGLAAGFLRKAIKAWRGTTRQASLRMYHRPDPPVLADA